MLVSAVLEADRVTGGRWRDRRSLRVAGVGADGFDQFTDRRTAIATERLVCRNECRCREQAADCAQPVSQGRSIGGDRGLLARGKALGEQDVFRCQLVRIPSAAVLSTGGAGNVGVDGRYVLGEDRVGAVVLVVRLGRWC
jgi:hypothetical protein